MLTRADLDEARMKGMNATNKARDNFMQNWVAPDLQAQRGVMWQALRPEFRAALESIPELKSDIAKLKGGI